MSYHAVDNWRIRDLCMNNTGWAAETIQVQSRLIAKLNKELRELKNGQVEGTNREVGDEHSAGASR